MRFVLVVSLVFFPLLSATGASISVGWPVTQSSLQFVQESRPRGWYSPEGISSDFPRLSPRDCARYGAEYGYAECGPVRRREAPAAERTTSVAAAPDARPRKPAAIKTARNKPLNNANEILTGTADATGEMQSLKVVLGHVLLARFQGFAAKDQSVVRIAKALWEKRLAGVVFQPSNIKNPAQLKDLVSAITKNEPGVLQPLLAIDQPGGLDTGLAEEKGFTFYAAPNLMARQQSAYDAQLVYGDMATELSRLGFNLNVGPEADPCSEQQTAISAKCFSGTPLTVAAFTAAFNFAHHDTGMLTAMRRVHRSKAMAALAETPGVLIMRELASKQPADAIIVPIDPDTTLKPEFVVAKTEPSQGSGENASLRVSGFDGAVIGELNVNGSGVPFRLDEAAIRAFEDGADAVLLPETISYNNESLTAVMTAIEKAVSSGRLPFSRLQEAAQKVDRMRLKLNTPAPASNAKVAQDESKRASASARP